MKIEIIKTFGILKKGQIHDRADEVAKKLIKLGHAIASDDKELKVEATKEFKQRTKTK